MNNYKRLTTRNITANNGDNSKLVEYTLRLRQLEKAIENGTLIFLPCRVGDTVYEVIKNCSPQPFVQQTKIEKIIITEKGLRLKLSRNSVYETSISSLGKTLFFTKVEAEKEWERLMGRTREFAECQDCPVWSSGDCTRHPHEGCFKEIRNEMLVE